MSLALGPRNAAQGETHRSTHLVPLMLVTAALSAAAGGLGVALLDRLADAGASPRVTSTVASEPLAAPSRESPVLTASSVFAGREAAPDDPMTGF